MPTNYAGLPPKAKPQDFTIGDKGNGIEIIAGRNGRIAIRANLPTWMVKEKNLVRPNFPRSSFYDGPIQPVGSCMWVPLGLRMVRAVVRGSTDRLNELCYARLSLHLARLGVSWEDVKTIFTESNPDPRVLWAIDPYTAYQSKQGTGLSLIALGTDRRLDHPGITIDKTLEFIRSQVDPTLLESFRDTIVPVFEDKILELNGIVRTPIATAILKAIRSAPEGTVAAFAKHSGIPYFDLQCFILDGTDPIQLKYWVPIAKTLSWLRGSEVSVEVLMAMDPKRYPSPVLDEMPVLSW